jgi:hypothetical protein
MSLYVGSGRLEEVSGLASDDLLDGAGGAVACYAHAVGVLRGCYIKVSIVLHKYDCKKQGTVRVK